jgi:hypothetical protein
MASHLADSIILRIRTDVLRGIVSLPEDEHDPWNEGQEGADWCFNEICLFRDLYEIVYPEVQHGLSSAQACHSVAEMSAFLQTIDESVLDGLFRFCICGGSSNPRHFELRENRDVNKILNEIIFLRL